MRQSEDKVGDMSALNWNGNELININFGVPTEKNKYLGIKECGAFLTNHIMKFLMHMELPTKIFQINF